MPDWIDVKTLLLIGHLFGVALGAGGAFVSDGLFFKSARDGVITKIEFDFLKLGGMFVSIGLLLLILSGAGMFLLDMERYLASTKFIAKMGVVAVLVLNGMVLHFYGIPKIRACLGKDLTHSDNTTFRRVLLASGAISLVSWMTAIVLGVFKSVPFPIENILGVYGVVMVVAIATALFLDTHVIVPKAK